MLESFFLFFEKKAYLYIAKKGKAMYIEDLALTMTQGLGVKGVVHLLEVFGDARSIFAASREELIHRAELRPQVADELLSEELTLKIYLHQDVLKLNAD